MRWLVGIDHRERSRGAVEMAVWLREHSRESAPHQLYAAHALDDHFRELSAELRDRLTAGARLATTESIAQVSATSPFTELHVDVDAAEAMLERLADVLAADALIIGRLGHREVETVTRLGRVARRLVRILPRPVLVVPPDLQRAEIGAGAILLATDLAPSSTAAALFARELASSLARELVVVYVDEGRGRERAPRPIDRDDVVAWARAQQLAPVRILIRQGDVVESVLATATAEHAPIVVVGSRRLAVGQRILSSSVGTDLARLSDRAIAIVPPE